MVDQEETLIVSEADRYLSTELGSEVHPRDISTFFYERRLPDGLCPLVGGRRLIPRACLPQIPAALREQQRKQGERQPCDDESP